MIPGANILSMAMTIIGRQPVLYFQDIGRTTSATGRYVPQYAPPCEIFECSVQPMPGEIVANRGFDAQKKYVTWFVQADVLGVDRDISGDIVEYDGSRYQCKTETDWFAQDGWKEVICVRVGNAG